jgi:hypothetical protein
MHSSILSPDKIRSLIFPLFLVALFSCSASKDESAQDKMRKLLTSGTWNVASVTADGEDKTHAFAGFSLTFTANTYATHQGDPVWAASGTWAFTDDKATAFTRDGDVLVTIRSSTDTHLSLSFLSNYPILEQGGRAESIAGEFVFELEK